MRFRVICARASVSFAVALCCAVPARAAAPVLDLTQALSLAYDGSPRLQSQRAALRAIDEDVARALAGWRPSVEVTGSYGYAQNSIPFVSLPNGHPWDQAGGGASLPSGRRRSPRK